MDLKIFPPEELAAEPVKLPLSKSESNRLLIISALTPGGKRPEALAECDDTDAMLAALDAGLTGRINIGAAGTAMRFLTAYFACTRGADVIIDGSDRMRERPIGPLVDALRSLGADIEYERAEGFPPLHIRGRMLEGGEVDLDASVSSQYVSALLMVAPTMEHGLRLRLRGNIISRPYIDMTLSLMESAGVRGELDDDTQIISVPNGEYHPDGLPTVEADWSAASYWFEIAAISTDPVTLLGLKRHSLQGDAAVRRLFEVTGLQSEWERDGSLQLQLTPDAGAQLQLNMADTPDLAQTMAVTCCLLGLPFRFDGLQSLLIKETNRLDALQMELSKLGFIVETDAAEGTLIWRGARFDPGEEIEPIATYHDHRMAMAFAPAAIFFPGLQINNAEVVSKSYPRYWAQLRRAGFDIQEVEPEGGVPGND